MQISSSQELSVWAAEGRLIVKSLFTTVMVVPTWKRKVKVSNVSGEWLILILNSFGVLQVPGEEEAWLGRWIQGEGLGQGGAGRRGWRSRSVLYTGCKVTHRCGAQELSIRTTKTPPTNQWSSCRKENTELLQFDCRMCQRNVHFAKFQFKRSYDSF